MLISLSLSQSVLVLKSLNLLLLRVCLRFSCLAFRLNVIQDPLGVQAQRVAVQIPTNNTLALSQYDNFAVIGRCDPSRVTQQWFLKHQLLTVICIYIT